MEAKCCRSHICCGFLGIGSRVLGADSWTVCSSELSSVSKLSPWPRWWNSTGPFHNCPQKRSQCRSDTQRYPMMESRVVLLFETSTWWPQPSVHAHILGPSTAVWQGSVMLKEKEAGQKDSRLAMGKVNWIPFSIHTSLSLPGKAVHIWRKHIESENHRIVWVGRDL